MFLVRRLAPTALAACVVLAACGGKPHPAAATHTPHTTAPSLAAAPSPSPSPAGPFATWTPICQRAAADMEAVGYSYGGSATGWTPPPAVTYGDLEKLGSKFARLSYLEMNGPTGNQDAQTANALGDAGTGFFKYLPAAAMINSQYGRIMHETARPAAINGWDNNYVSAITSDCANGGG
jgi:hypothetical protein